MSEDRIERLLAKDVDNLIEALIAERNQLRIELDEQRKRRAKAEASMIVVPAECDENCDDPDCPYSHVPLTLRQAYENSVSRMREAGAEVSRLRAKLAEAENSADRIEQLEADLEKALHHLGNALRISMRNESADELDDAADFLAATLQEISR